MQSHHAEHSNLNEDINTAKGIMVNLKQQSILWEKEKERTEKAGPGSWVQTTEGVTEGGKESMDEGLVPSFLMFPKSLLLFSR